ncbi:MerR family transcriptional regulator [Sporolactobacillus sp. KGMB 08714]|uniref:MerR family transcriptional regulator n=1 Tax=Sporolactobacillus sp. KGMB 08714 TaxID=3064704 RepID=UPI002FBDB8C6
MYSINQVAKICDLSPYTIRFYDKEGLLPFISRGKNRRREFSEADLDLVKLICCLKNTGMSIKEIRRYINLCMQGPETVEMRKKIMKAHRENILRQISDLKKNLNIVDLKIAFYNTEESSHAFISGSKD